MSPAEPEQLLVWRFAGAVLAAPIERVREVATTGDDGRARTREGEIDLTFPTGLHAPRPAPRAVVVEVAGRVIALPADSVEGVVPVDAGAVEAPPAWVARLEPGHVRGLVRLGPLVAAVLHLEALAEMD